MNECKSEYSSTVTELRRQIAEELEAMQRGFSAYAAGVARHDFIRARMEQVGDRQEELSTYIGPDDAAHIVCELYINKVTGKDKS